MHRPVQLPLRIFIHLPVSHVQQKADHKRMEELQPVRIKRIIHDARVDPEFHITQETQAERIDKIRMHAAPADAVAEKSTVVFPQKVGGNSFFNRRLDAHAVFRIDKAIGCSCQLLFPVYGHDITGLRGNLHCGK